MIADAFARLRALKPGPARLYIAGCSGEPMALALALKASPELARDLTFVGVPVPGLNRTDWTALHETARAEMPFLYGDMRAGFDAGRIRLRPMHYSDSYRDMVSGPIDLAVVVVSPPEADGRVSLGVSADFSGAVLARPDIPVMAIVSRNMPAPADTPRVLLSRPCWVGTCLSAIRHRQCAAGRAEGTVGGWRPREPAYSFRAGDGSGSGADGCGSDRECPGGHPDRRRDGNESVIRARRAGSPIPFPRRRCDPWH